MSASSDSLAAWEPTEQQLAAAQYLAGGYTQQRACLDALTAVAYREDAQVVSVRASKVYCEAGQPPGVWVVVRAGGNWDRLFA